MEPLAFYLPTVPFSVIDAVNRYAAATGSPRYACASSGADYNGHHVAVTFNTFRGYWIAEYMWAGRNVIGRGSLAEALTEGKRLHARGAKGATVTAVYPEPRASDRHVAPEARDWFSTVCRAAGMLEGSEGRPAWRTELHDLVSDAFNCEAHFGVPAIGFLTQARDAADYKERVERFLAERRAERRGA